MSFLKVLTHLLSDVYTSLKCILSNMIQEPSEIKLKYVKDSFVRNK